MPSKTLPPSFDGGTLSYTRVQLTLCLSSMVLVALVLAGCSSESALMPNLFLMSAKYNNGSTTLEPVILGLESARFAQNVTTSSLQIRVGYSGICAKGLGNSWGCSSNASDLASGYTAAEDPLNVIWLASRFRAQIVYPWIYILCLILTTMTAIILCTFPNWHDEIDPIDGSTVDAEPFPTKTTMDAYIACSSLSAFSAVAQLVRQHTCSRAASIFSEAAGYGRIEAELGLSAAAISWALVACQVFLCAMSILYYKLVMILDKWKIEGLRMDSDDEKDSESESESEVTLTRLNSSSPVHSKQPI